MRSPRPLRLLPVLLVSCPLAGAQVCQPLVDLAATNPAGISGNGYSQTGSLSADGRWVAFASAASDLVAGDTNGVQDVFVKDLETGLVKLVSRSKGNLFVPSQIGNADSFQPSISGDGRLVAFDSLATNLVAGDTNGVSDVFVVDVLTGDIQRASAGFGGLQANGSSWVASISSNGRFVAFQSLASNLAVFGDPNGTEDVYVRDLQLQITYPGSVTWDGQWGNGSSRFGCMTPDGRYLAFYSEATNMSPIDTNAYSDIFVRDFVNDFTIMASVGPGGFFPTPGNEDSTSPTISDDGRYVAFLSRADNLAGVDDNDRDDVFVRDLVANTTGLVSQIPGILPLVGNSGSSQPRISADGRYVVYVSAASDLVPNDDNGYRDIFVRDRVLGVNKLVSVTHISGLPGGGAVFNPRISGDGQRVCFDSDWSGFAYNDFNFQRDTFVTWTECFAPTVFCTAKVASLGCLPSITWTGSALSSGLGNFHLRALGVINQKPGLLIYGISGPAAIPFQGGTLCVQPPTRRSSIVFSGGSPPPLGDCTGSFDLDMDAFATGQLGGNPLPELTQAGATITAQWWGRDPGYPAPNDTQLSNALSYDVLF